MDGDGAGAGRRSAFIPPMEPPLAARGLVRAYGRLTATSNGLLESVINIADAGQSPQDGFTEYQGFPGPTRPRWGDYSWAIFLPGSGGRIYFANEYIQYPNCAPPAFQLHQLGTCGGTRNSLTNWGTSVNYVVP